MSTVSNWGMPKKIGSELTRRMLVFVGGAMESCVAVMCPVQSADSPFIHEEELWLHAMARRQSSSVCQLESRQSTIRYRCQNDSLPLAGGLASGNRGVRQ
jgi:hypothetical protein